ncbi:MAG: 4Fe-4S dicluster domain-containing protein, partial [Desulfobacteraceae bacterium]|nr:4Fe-4S dicluster domain-containing protein [Desulfobacteraceae bacterium]
EYGPRVRLAKVFTDLDLTKDKPKTFGVKQFCEICRACADACPGKAISKTPTTTDKENKPHNDCNNPGADKWFNNHQKCLQFWGESWTECGVCISVCPYNKPQKWNHDVAKMMTRVPGVNRIIRYLDHVFGYGKAHSEQLMKDFWHKTI